MEELFLLLKASSDFNIDRGEPLDDSIPHTATVVLVPEFGGHVAHTDAIKEQLTQP